ncbi:MAG TPA: GNAT family N-acetyltransferase [Anaerolineae bacterium]|nr:GNAT family N-acetyltransferase [Anaerolineae bacterium]
MSEGLCIRPATLDDVAPLLENCFSMNTVEQIQELVEKNLRIFEEGKGVQLVATVDGVAIAALTLMRREHPLEAHRAELTGLVVHPDYQRQGIARRLVEESKTYARDMGTEILEVSCRGGEVAETVYRRLGFIEWGRLPRGLVEPWGEYKVYDVVHFYQPLG